MTTARIEPIGVLGVVQTPFTTTDEIDGPSLERLVADALESEVDGFLVPAVASENAFLSHEEKIALATRVSQITAGSVPVFWGAGSFDADACVEIAQTAKRHEAAGLLVAVSPELFANQERIVPFFIRLSSQIGVPLMIQDWQPGGEGMRIEIIRELFEKVERFKYLKVETIPAGPKYTAVLEATNGKLHVSGGWAVQQMIEALDRGVHAMIPECSMIRIYKRIDMLHRSGRRGEAKNLFERLLPVLCFTNQQLDVSIRFFKQLLRRKGIFSTEHDRLKSPPFDAHSERIAEELIERVLALEEEIKREAPA